MSSSIDVKVKVNLNGVAEALQDLEPRITRKLLRRALTAVGAMWIDEVKQRVPVKLGDLRDSIIAKVRTRKAKKGGDGLPSGSVDVGPGMIPRSDDKESVGPGIYGMFVEFGLKNKDYPSEPFLRPTFDSTTEKAVQVFADSLKDNLEDIARD
jgi:HK97 gp10 family phage protein